MTDLHEFTLKYLSKSDEEVGETKPKLANNRQNEPGSNL